MWMHFDRNHLASFAVRPRTPPHDWIFVVPEFSTAQQPERALPDLSEAQQPDSGSPDSNSLV